MPTACTDTTYAEQVESDALQLRAATGLTHDQHIAALRLLVTAQLMEAEFILAEHQLPIPWPAQAQHAKDHHANPVHRRL